MRLHSLFLCSIGAEKHQGLGKTLSIKKAREIRFKPASRAFYVITLIIFCEIMLRKHSKKCTFYTLRFGCSFAAVNTIKPQLL